MITSINRPRGRSAAPHRRRTHFLAAAGLGLLAACSGGQQSIPGGGDDVVASYGGFGVTSGSVFEITGPVGGPFPQGERTYRLQNFGTTLLAWELETSVPWLNSTATGGAISPGVDSEITISIDQDQAALLPAGTYPADIVFRDRDDLDGTVYLAFVLHVVESGAGAELAVGPAGAFEMYGIDGGSLSPTQKSYMLTNVGSDPLSWNVQLDAGWVNADVWSGDLDPGQSTSVQLTADAAQVLALGVGQHTTLAHFINTTNDAGTTQRPVRATIDPLQGGGGDRVTDGLVSLYDFEAGGGTLVQDLGGSGLDLTVQDPSAVQWVPGALRLVSPTFVSTSGPATALTSLVQASDELTVEAWLKPANVSQDGPARIVTLSGGTLERNFTLGQGLWGSLASDSFNLRLRTSNTDLDGMPLQDTGGGWATTALTHVVATRDSAGNETIYVDGQVAKSAVVGGVLDGWDASYVLGLGNEVGGGRPWLGDLHLVALYDRALSDAEVQQNLGAGPQDEDSSLLSVSPAGTFQVSGVLNAALSATSTTYTLSNDGSAALDWGVTQDVSWFDLQGPLSGTLFPGDTVDLVCDLDPTAIFSLGIGTHQGSIEFTNLTDGLGSTTRAIQVTVQDDNSGGGNNGGNNGGGGGWDPANHPTLTPGSGWSGATNQPGQVGSGFAADRKTVARWDVVQALDVTEPSGLGVLAFHTNGIQKVEMAVNGGPWVELTLMEPNPRTGVAEYWAVLDPSLFGGNQVAEVRAIAYPNAGRPRLLDSLWVNVLPNPTSDGEAYVSTSGSDSAGNGTASSPFRTISKAAQHLQSVGGGKADGGTIYLANGDYSIDSQAVTTQSRYLTVTTAPGASRAGTRIVGHSGYGLNTKRLRLKNLTIRTYMDTTPYVGNFLWLDGCHQKGDGQLSATGPGSSTTWLPSNFPWNWMGMTDCEVSDAKYGPTMSYFQRGTYIHHIGSDVFRYPNCLIDVTIQHVNPGSTGWHSDLIEISGGYTQENMLLYNVNATDVNAQGLFVKAPGGQTTTLRDSALVNFVIHKTNDVWISQFSDNSSVSNVLFWNCTFANMALGVRSSGVTSLDFQSSVMAQVYASDGGQLQESWFEDCHFISGGAHGVDASSGNPSNLFQNAGALDFSPGSGSPLLNRATVQVPYDLNGVLRSLPGTIGALEE